MSFTPPQEEFFPITAVHRDDLEAIGFDGATVDDGTMIQLAGKMANAYVDHAFWVDLEIIAEILGIPKRR